MPTENQYVKAVKAARAAARDIARSRMVSNLMTVIRGKEATLKGLDTEVKHYEKTIEMAEFRLRIATEQKNPDLENIKEDQLITIESAKKGLESVQKEKEEVVKAIEGLNKEISEVTTGVKKVDFEKMEDRAKELLSERYTKAFVEGEYDNVADA